MNTDRFKYKESTGIVLKSFHEVYNEFGDGFLNLSEKISTMISVNLWLNN